MGARHLGLEMMSNAVAAAAAAMVLGVFAPLFLIPQPIVCGHLSGYGLDLRGGDLYQGKPETVRVAIHREGSVFVGPLRVRPSELREALIRVRRHRGADVPLELDAHPQVTLGQLEKVFDAARAAGYTSYLVFGPELSVLQLGSHRAASATELRGSAPR